MKKQKKEINKQVVVMIAEPLGPKYLPNKPAEQEPIKGNVIISRYIFLSNNGFEPLTSSL